MNPILRKLVFIIINLLLLNLDLFSAAKITVDDLDDSNERVLEDKPYTEKQESKRVQDGKEESKESDGQLVNWKEVAKKGKLTAQEKQKLNDKISALPKVLQKIVAKKAIGQYLNDVSDEHMEALYFAVYDFAFYINDTYNLFHDLRLINRLTLGHDEDRVIVCKINYFQTPNPDGSITRSIGIKKEKVSFDILSNEKEFFQQYPKNVPGQILCIIFPKSKKNRAVPNSKKIMIFPDSKKIWLFSDINLSIIGQLSLEQIDYIKKLYLCATKNTKYYPKKLFAEADEGFSGDHSTVPLWYMKYMSDEARPKIDLNRKAVEIHKSLPAMVKNNLECHYNIDNIEREKRAKRCGKISLLLYSALCAPVLAYQYLLGE